MYNIYMSIQYRNERNRNKEHHATNNSEKTNINYSPRDIIQKRITKNMQYLKNTKCNNKKRGKNNCAINVKVTHQLL